MGCREGLETVALPRDEFRRMLRPYLMGNRPQPVSQEIAPGEYGKDAPSRHGGRDVDGADVRMSVGRAHHHGIGLAGKIDVVGVTALAGHEAQVLLAADRLSDAGAG